MILLPHKAYRPMMVVEQDPSGITVSLLQRFGGHNWIDRQLPVLEFTSLRIDQPFVPEEVIDFGR